MGKIEKKIERLKEQIEASEKELVVALTKKVHSALEVSVPTLTTRIKNLKAELAKLL